MSGGGGIDDVETAASVCTGGVETDVVDGNDGGESCGDNVRKSIELMNVVGDS